MARTDRAGTVTLGRRIRDDGITCSTSFAGIPLGVVVDNAGGDHDQICFGATVTVTDGDADERTVTIVGVDELDPDRGRVSWVSLIAKALPKSTVGDVVTLETLFPVRKNWTT